jgi:hypothetical protein
MYPKMPLLMIDFSNEAHLRRHEMTQRAITELTSGVIGISRFTNWYYFVGADLYDFWAARRGTATNQQERLNCYSKFRVALALDQTVESNLRAAMQRRVNAIAVNPLETSPQNELRAAVQRYDLLRAAAADEDSPLQQRLTRDRRSELARFEATNAQQARAGIFHYASFGFYTRRAPEPDFLDRLEIYRQVDYDANLLDSLTSAGTSPEVAYDSQRIEKVIAELSALVPQVGSETVRLHAQRAIEKVNGLSADLELKTQCRAALDSIHPPALESASTR